MVIGTVRDILICLLIHYRPAFDNQEIHDNDEHRNAVEPIRV